MYPFSISIDEHVPLNMSAGRIFFQGRVNSGFSRGGSKYCCRRVKVVKLDFHHSKLRKQPFLKKCDGKMSNLKILEALLPTPMPLKLRMAKRLRKLAKIHLPIGIYPCT